MAASDVERFADCGIRTQNFHYKKNRFKAFIEGKDANFPWLSAACPVSMPWLVEGLSKCVHRHFDLRLSVKPFGNGKLTERFQTYIVWLRSHQEKNPTCILFRTTYENGLYQNEKMRCRVGVHRGTLSVNLIWLSSLYILHLFLLPNGLYSHRSSGNCCCLIV